MGILCSYMVFCYDPSEDKWTTLPPLTVRCFGLGQLDGELVAVGGVKKRDSEVTREVYSMMSDNKSGSKCRFLPCQQLELLQVC